MICKWCKIVLLVIQKLRWPRSANDSQNNGVILTKKSKKESQRILWIWSSSFSFQDNEVTEIMVTSHDYIAFEKGEEFPPFKITFAQKFLPCDHQTNFENLQMSPSKIFLWWMQKFLDFRLHLITDEVTKTNLCWLYEDTPKTSGLWIDCFRITGARNWIRNSSSDFKTEKVFLF